MSTPNKRGLCSRLCDLATHFGLFPFASAIRRRGGRPTRGRDCPLCGRGRHLHYQFTIPSNSGEVPLPLFTELRSLFSELPRRVLLGSSLNKSVRQLGTRPLSDVAATITLARYSFLPPKYQIGS